MHETLNIETDHDALDVTNSSHRRQFYRTISRRKYPHCNSTSNARIAKLSG